jgi:hypothetical protein
MNANKVSLVVLSKIGDYQCQDSIMNHIASPSMSTTGLLQNLSLSGWTALAIFLEEVLEKLGPEARQVCTWESFTTGRGYCPNDCPHMIVVKFGVDNNWLSPLLLESRFQSSATERGLVIDSLLTFG